MEKDGKLIDVLLRENFTYGNALKVLRKKDVRVNDKRVSENVSLSKGDKLTIYYLDDVNKYDIVFDGEHALVVYKYAGTETCDLAEELKVIAVHRLDRNTEGLIVFAKDAQTKESLEKAFKNHLVNKFYLAEVVGSFVTDKLYTAYLVKDAERALVKIYDQPLPNAKKIETKVTTLKASSESSVLKVQIIGGKTHQIRAHLAHLGHAIIGDGKYSRREDYKRFKAKHQMLFAYKLEFKDVGVEELNNKTFKVLPEFTKKLNVAID